MYIEIIIRIAVASFCIRRIYKIILLNINEIAKYKYVPYLPYYIEYTLNSIMRWRSVYIYSIYILYLKLNQQLLQNYYE
jgi:hypothetical protein